MQITQLLFTASFLLFSAQASPLPPSQNPLLVPQAPTQNEDSSPFNFGVCLLSTLPVSPRTILWTWLIDQTCVYATQQCQINDVQNRDFFATLPCIKGRVSLLLFCLRDFFFFFLAAERRASCEDTRLTKLAVVFKRWRDMRLGLGVASDELWWWDDVKNRNLRA